MTAVARRVVVSPILSLLALLLAAPAAPARAAAEPRPARSAATPVPPEAEKTLARDLLEELIEINTTDSVGDNTKAAEAMAARLRAAGFDAKDAQVLVPHPRKGNLVARLRGKGAGEPILLLAHIDVVEALRSDWSRDPFTFVEEDGYFYGRGTSDDKAMAAIWIANLIRYKKEGFVPGRDLIVALTADEEGGDHNGVTWLIKEHRDLIDAEYALNEGGGGQIVKGKRLLNEVQATEKVYLSFRLEARNPGGHSSLPPKDNAIYHLANGLANLSRYDFPVRLNEVTREFFTRMAALETGRVAADMAAVTRTPPDAAAVGRLAAQPYYNALMRTTCVATRVNAGHADNALPQTATAVVNCRLLPDESPAEVEATLKKVLADDAIAVTPIAPPNPSPPSPLKPAIMGAIEKVTTASWPGIPVVPVMGTGATDGLFLRQSGIPVYGVSGIFEDIDDVRSHGRDERMGVREFYEGQEFLYRLVKELAAR